MATPLRKDSDELHEEEPELVLLHLRQGLGLLKSSSVSDKES